MELNFDPNSINNDFFAEDSSVSSNNGVKRKSIINSVWSKNNVSGAIARIGALALKKEKVRDVQKFSKYRDDGTLESLTIIKSNGSIEECHYDSSGKHPLNCTIITQNMKIEQIFNDKLQVIESFTTNLRTKKVQRTLNYFHKNGIISKQINYGENNYTEYNYDTKGRITSTTEKENNKISYRNEYFYSNNERSWAIKKEEKNGIITTYYRNNDNKITKEEIHGKNKNITHYRNRDGEYSQTVAKEQIKNKYYTGKIQYKTIVTNSLVIVKEDKENGKEYKINLYEFLAPFNDNEKELFIKALHVLPGEVIVDMITEVTFSNNTIKKGSNGEYNHSNDIIKLKGGSFSANTIIHELGHAIDFLSISKLTDKSQTQSCIKFQLAFEHEMKNFELAGNKRATIAENDSEYKVDNSYSEQWGSTYCTLNEKEMFAECYVLLMLGESNAEKVITTFFPKTLACAKEILENTRNKPDILRHNSSNNSKT